MSKMVGETKVGKVSRVRNGQKWSGRFRHEPTSPNLQEGNRPSQSSVGGLG